MIYFWNFAICLLLLWHYPTDSPISYIYVFDKGRIYEYSTHAELMEEKGLYEELYHMQAQFYVQEESS